LESSREPQQTQRQRLKLLGSLRVLRALKRWSKHQKKLKSGAALEGRQVMFLPDIAYRNERGEVVASLQAWVYRQKNRRQLTHILARMFGLDIASLDKATRQIFYARTQLFMVNSREGCELDVRDGQGQHYRLCATGADGRSHKLITLFKEDEPKEIGDKIHFHLDGASPHSSVKATCLFVPPQGISIISDIDDTIKQSFVTDKKKLLRATFLEDYKPVPQMCDWYQDLAKKAGTAFHYVSSSPIQLYPALYDFMRTQSYPEGSMHLREATRWSEVLPRPGRSKKHKKAAITRLLRAFPTRKFILIGDTGGDDALIYAEFAVRYPQQIAAICMRSVTSSTNSRIYDKIFAAVAPDTWLVSDNVGEMRQFIADLDIL